MVHLNIFCKSVIPIGVMLLGFQFFYKTMSAQAEIRQKSRTYSTVSQISRETNSPFLRQIRRTARQRHSNYNNRLHKPSQKTDRTTQYLKSGSANWANALTSTNLPPKNYEQIALEFGIPVISGVAPILMLQPQRRSQFSEEY